MSMPSCQLCARHHSMQKVCGFHDLAHRVTKLLEANSIIPSVLAANKEAVTMAEGFRHMLKKADEAHAILMGVLARHPGGEAIKLDYLEELDKWGKETSDLGTPEQLDLPGLLNESHPAS